MQRYLSLLLMPFLFSCGLYPTVPMETMTFNASDTPAKHLIVLISGRGATADYFKTNNWVEIARQRGVDADFVAPYAHYGYYMTRELLPRLNEDVIIPAKQQGYQSISLVGISMGGLGSILYSEKFPENIDRLYLVAPYLGEEVVHKEIRSEGGLKSWQIKKENETDWNHYIWRHLQDITANPQLKNQIFLGYGEQDDMRGLDILEQSMPAGHVVTVPGSHKDVVFAKLWGLMLDKGFVDTPKAVVGR